MFYEIVVEGTSPIIPHSTEGMLKSPLTAERGEIISKKKHITASDESRLAQIETELGIYWDETGVIPTIPCTVFRASLLNGAKKYKEGGDVREGTAAMSSIFRYDSEKYGETKEELVNSAQFASVVVVSGKKIIITRPKFDTPWSATFILEVDLELVDKNKMERWVDTAGRRVGMCDWRPQKSGIYGRFQLVEIKEIENLY